MQIFLGQPQLLPRRRLTTRRRTQYSREALTTVVDLYEWLFAFEAIVHFLTSYCAETRHMNDLLLYAFLLAGWIGFLTPHPLACRKRVSDLEAPVPPPGLRRIRPC